MNKPKKGVKDSGYATGKEVAKTVRNSVLKSGYNAGVLGAEISKLKGKK